ncbi:helix-turn-helix domain-containing protein, partial [Serratia ficaria]|uniref:helix-turn-helix domain-containing protein n=1 Tax=Serratia ficaria TaxID=61651 RepID=UPI003704CAAF
MNIRLSPEQIAALEAQHRHSRDRRVCDRIRCVLLSAQGWSTTMIAQSQLIHETTVLRHIADYLDEGNGACQGSCRLSRFMRPVFPAPDSATLLPAGSSFAL